MTDEQTSIPASRPIETIVVEFDDLITAMQYNAENRNQNEYKNLRVQHKNIDSEGCVKADLFHDDHSHYPTDISLTPIHLQPNAFIGGEDVWDVPSEAEFPIRNDERARCKDHHGLECDESIPDATWDEWWGVCTNHWMSHVKSALRSSVTTTIDGQNETFDIEIQFTDE